MSDSLIPVTLLTGFLGSGKTTVLNHLLCQPTLARTLVIINEFGAVGLDHLLVSRVADDAVVELTSGCLCCTVRGDLVNTLKDAHWRYARGGERRFDRVVIETTGLADPAPIIHTLMTVGVIVRRYRLDGVVATLDLTNADQTLDAQPEALKQAAMADCLLLTKADLVAPAAIAALQRRLDGINPAARRLLVQHGAVAPTALLGLGLFDPARKVPDVARWLNAEAFLDTGRVVAVPLPRPGRQGPVQREVAAAPPDRQAPDPADQARGEPARGGHTHPHDPNRHDEHIRAFCLVIEPPLAEDMLDAWLDLLMSLSGRDLLRVKGILHLCGRSGPVVIHGVQHIFHPAVELPAWPDDDRRSKIVFITRDIPRETIEDTLAAFIAVWRGQTTGAPPPWSGS